MRRILDFLDPNYLRDYIVLDKVKFKQQIHARILALGAAGYAFLTEQAKSTFSAPTAGEFMDAMFFEELQPMGFEVGVIANSLATYLDEGFPSFSMLPYLKRKALMKGGRVIVPIDPYRKRKFFSPPNRMPISVDQIDSLVENNRERPNNIIAGVQSLMAGKQRPSTIGVNRQKGFFLPGGEVFKTVSLSTPDHMWKHPGVKGYFLMQKLHEFMGYKKNELIADLFPTTFSLEWE